MQIFRSNPVCGLNQMQGFILTNRIGKGRLADNSNPDGISWIIRASSMFLLARLPSSVVKGSISCSLNDD